MSKKDLDIKELENGWLEVPFSYMVENISQRVEPSQSDLDIFIGLEHLDPLSLKINRWGSPKELKGTKLLAKPGDIIFGKRNAYLRKAAVCEVDAIVSAHAMILRPREENVLKEFVYFFMQTDEFYKRSMMISEGSISPTIKWKILSEERFYIPSMRIQHDIVNKLKCIENLINNNEKLLLKSSIYRTKLIEQIFIKDVEGNNKFKLSEIADIIMGQSPPSESYNSTGDGIAFYQGNAEFGKLHPTPKKWCTKPNKIAKRGSILMSVRAPIGDLNIANEDCCIGRGLCSINGKNYFTNSYIKYLLEANSAELQKRGSGSTFSAINGSDLNNLLVNVHSENEITLALDKIMAIDVFIESVESNLEDLRKLKMKILGDLIEYYAK